jgi:hypothetical protein
VASSPIAPSSRPSLRALLFAADHTLLDTSKAERCAEAGGPHGADYNPAVPLERKRWTRPS